MRISSTPFLLASSFLVAALSSSSCGGGDASAPGAGAPPATPDDSGPTTVVPNDPGDDAGEAESASSLSQTLSSNERRLREADQREDASLIANAIAPRFQARFVPGFTGLFEFTIFNTGSGWQEKFLLQIPPTPPTGPAPMLVVFHKFGTSHGDVLNTTFLAESQARGWYCVAPLGARQKHFGNIESQINTRAALDLVAHLFPVDRDRVYGVGFSMGGGAMANYAARHLDPSGIRFAALCDHTGGVSLAHTWFNEPDDADLDDDLPLPGQNLEVPDVLEDLFGGPPSAVPFAYQRSSTIDLDPNTGVIGPNTDLGRNLEHVPTLVWVADHDPLAYVVTQTYAFDGYLQAQNAAHQLNVASGNFHSWTTLDETAVCDWLQTKTLQTPTSGRLLADENGRWLHFDVEQNVAGAFTPFTFDVDTLARRITLTQSANLRRVSVHAAAAGVPLTGVVSVRLATADGTGDRVRLLGATNAPITVTRDGVAASGTYDALLDTFEIVETSPTRHDWVLTFP